MSAESIFNKAVELVQLPPPRYTGYKQGQSAVYMGSGWVQGTSRGIGVSGMTPLPEFNFKHPPSVAAVKKGQPVPASYSATVSVLNYAPPPVPSAPEYGKAVSAPTFPDQVVVSAPPMNYPQHGTLDLGQGAGLQMAAKPDVQVGVRPTLIHPALADFNPTPIAPYDGPLPEYVPPAIEPVSLPEPRSYDDDAALIARLKRTLGGEDALNVAAQQVLYEELAMDLRREELRGIRKILTETAARGFSMPTGAANGAIAEHLKEVARKRAEASFKVRDETYERARKKLIDAAGHAMTLEKKHVELHLSHARKLLQTIKFNVAMEKALFDSVVDAFNQKTEMVQLVMRDYKRYLSAIEAQGKAVVNDVKAELAKVTTYRADVGMYGAQIGTVKTISDIEAMDVKQKALLLAEYESYLIGVAANTGIVKRNIEGYREAVQMLARGADIEADRFDAWADQMQAEMSALDVDEANVSAYEKYWQVESARQSSYASYVNDATQVFNAEVGEFREYLGAHRSYIAAAQAGVNAEAGAVAAFNREMRAGVGYVTAYNRAQSEIANAENMRRLADASASMTSAALRMQAEVEEAQIEASRVAANATIAAGLAQSALGVISAGMSISGSTGASQTASTTGSTSVSESATRSWSRRWGDPDKD